MDAVYAHQTPWDVGLIMGLGGAAGTYLGGYLADSLATRTPQWYVRVPALGAAIGVPFAALSIMSDNTTLVLIALAFTYVSYSFFLAPCIAVTHNMVKPHMRAFSSAILFFVLNLIGLGFGPLSIGLASDLLEPQLGAHSLRWAMLLAVFMTIVGIVLFLSASRFVEKDLEVD